MTDSHRRDGAPQENQQSPNPPHSPWGEQWERGRERLARDAAAAPAPDGAAGPYPGQGDVSRETYPGAAGPAAPAGAGYPPPPPHPPRDPWSAPGYHEAHSPQDGGGAGRDLGNGAAFEPAPAGGPARAARAKRPVALLAAVALAAAVIGGATAAGVEQLFGERSGSGGGFPGTNVSQTSTNTVAGVAEEVSPSVVRIDIKKSGGTGTGSGIVITKDGEVVTNNHVIDGASEIQVTLADGKKYAAKVVGTDPAKDLALIKLEGASGLKAAKLGDSGSVKVGEQVVAIGSPDRLTGTVTSGIVSALDREVSVPKSDGGGQQQQQQQSPYGGGGWPFSFDGRQFNGDTGNDTTSYKAIQTDASLNPGNSGGALINMNGEIIGMPSAIYSPSSGGEAGSVGLGFAIPVNTIKADLDHLRSGGDGGSGNGSSQDGGSGSGDGFFGTGF
ncbi:trypsin-like peptidase domain-containing protein [Streptomyces sp. NPDC097619]|uniref:S1C family serine protease n=1 Tax=Streptomyces sp. NPDC097619 TaxID=3157228 RepID=UPI0033219161